MGKSLFETYFSDIFETDLITEILECGKFMEVEVGHILASPNKITQAVPIILSGSVKISKLDDEGRETLLYYLKGMDSCVMSLNYCLNPNQKTEISAIVEDKTILMAIPAFKIPIFFAKYSSWRQFVFSNYQKRYDDLLMVVEDVLYKKLDERLIKLLEGKSQLSNSKVFFLTHEELANDLSTSREVISRVLKQLEKNGKVKMSRNRLELL